MNKVKKIILPNEHQACSLNIPNSICKAPSSELFVVTFVAVAVEGDIVSNSVIVFQQGYFLEIVRRIQSITHTNTQKHPKYFHHAACWLAGLGTQLPLVKEFWLIIDLEANLLHLVNERSERLIELKEFMCVFILIYF